MIRVFSFFIKELEGRLMKVLITGADGQLGRELIKQFSDNYRYNIIAGGKKDLDITDFWKVKAVIYGLVPDIVINCAGFTDVDGCEKDERKAFCVNALGVKNLAQVSGDLGIKIVHISSDYVFSGKGKEVLFREYDQTDPVNIYGKSKLLGEKFIEQFNPRHFILRTSCLYGEGDNFIRTIIRLAANRSQLSVVDDQYGTPTSARDMAKVILFLIKSENYGLYHATSQGFCSRYQLAEYICKKMDISINLIKIKSKDYQQAAKRPHWSVLDNFMLKLNGLDVFPDWRDALEKYLSI